MRITARKPATPGEILVGEFLQPMNVTQGALAEALGVPRKHVNELCNDKRSITVPTRSCWLACLATVQSSG